MIFDDFFQNLIEIWRARFSLPEFRLTWSWAKIKINREGFVSYLKIKTLFWYWFWRKCLKSTYFSTFIKFDKDICSKICCPSLIMLRLNRKRNVSRKNSSNHVVIRSFEENSKVDLIFLFFSFHWIWQRHLLQNLLPQA